MLYKRRAIPVPSPANRMLETFGSSDAGCKRKLNEDRILIDPELSLFVVADGMGGQRFGDRAAEIVVGAIEKHFRRTAGQQKITWPYGYDAMQSLGSNLMVTAIRLANDQV